MAWHDCGWKGLKKKPEARVSDYYRQPEDVLPLWRKSDPPQSVAAGRKAKTFRGDHRRRILDALAAGPAGQTEIARRAEMTVAQVSKRLPELRRDGVVERTGRDVAGGEAEYRIPLQNREANNAR